MADPIGVDVGGTSVRVMTGPGGVVRTMPSPSTLAELPALIGGCIEEPAAIGVGCTGLVDHALGLVRWSPHLVGRDLRLRHDLESRFGVPVWVDNDANVAALAEATTGAGVGHRMVLMITVGTGIGAGLVIDGRIERGRANLGEVGHMRVAETGTCACGRLGCWEVYASGRALDRGARALDPAADGAWLVERAREGDSLAMAAVEPMAAALALGIANLVLVLDPDVVVLGGMLPTAGDVVVAPLLDHLAAVRGGLTITGLPPIVLATHGDRAGLEGAIIGAMEVRR
jgi:glucokinase